MPLDTIGLYNDVNEIWNHSKNAGSSPCYAFQLAASNAIRTAVASGLQTCTISTSTYPQLILTTEMNNLWAMGYKVSLNVSTLTISWPL
jgi:hypothetical protein